MGTVTVHICAPSHTGTWTSVVPKASSLHMHLSYERCLLFLGISHEFALMQAGPGIRLETVLNIHRSTVVRFLPTRTCPFVGTMGEDAPQSECRRKRISARLCPPWHSRSFASVRWSNHHCFQPPHVVEDSTVFMSFSPLHSVASSRPSPRSFPSSWPGSAPFTLLPSDATGKSLPRWMLALTREAVRGSFSMTHFSPRHPHISAVFISAV